MRWSPSGRTDILRIPYSESGVAAEAAVLLAERMLGRGARAILEKI
jgi:hypothetical protein